VLLFAVGPIAWLASLEGSDGGSLIARICMSAMRSWQRLLTLVLVPRFNVTSSDSPPLRPPIHRRVHRETASTVVTHAGRDVRTLVVDTNIYVVCMSLTLSLSLPQKKKSPCTGCSPVYSSASVILYIDIDSNVRTVLSSSTLSHLRQCRRSPCVRNSWSRLCVGPRVRVLSAPSRSACPKKDVTSRKCDIAKSIKVSYR
jgi:hypothetical protein